MKHCLLLSLLLALWCMHVRGAPLENDGMEQGSCEDPQAKGAAALALSKINADRKEGYVFGLHRLYNVHMTKHGANGVLFYLTINVVETNCSVLSKKDWKECEARPTHDTPVYGQCKAAIFINKPQRVVRLYKYNCVVRPVPAAKVSLVCPDCPTHISVDHSEVQKTVTLSLEKFNKESGLSKHFSLLKVTRAVSGMGMVTHYNVEYTIQETVCPRSTEPVTAEKCPFIECEFSHNGFCKASLFYPPMGTGDASVNVECEIYEPEAAERQKKLHLLGGEHDHSHSDTHAHNPAHDQAHASNDQHVHDHVHDHTKGHAHHDKTLVHGDNTEHHHVHDHAAGSGHVHAHDHSHDHGHGHNHTHAHHAKAHDHSGDLPNQHHDYKHAQGMHTHEHDHELALDHDHKHPHLHEHEHHHHHDEHIHEKEAHDNPEGMVRVLPAMDPDLPMILPSFPDAPAAGPEVGVVLPLKPDPQIPDEMEPTILPFPTTVSAQCSPPLIALTLVEQMLSEDPMFKVAA